MRELYAALASLQAIPRTGVPGVDANLRRAVMALQLALWNAGAEDAAPEMVGAGAGHGEEISLNSRLESANGTVRASWRGSELESDDPG